MRLFRFIFDVKRAFALRHECYPGRSGFAAAADLLGEFLGFKRVGPDRDRLFAQVISNDIAVDGYYTVALQGDAGCAVSWNFLEMGCGPVWIIPGPGRLDEEEKKDADCESSQSHAGIIP